MSEHQPLGVAQIEKHRRRLQKNREAAQQFRERQKIYITSLEKSHITLTADNAMLTAKVEALKAENRTLQESLTYMREVIGQSLQGSAAAKVEAQPSKT
jgi:hypothetical protein